MAAKRPVLGEISGSNKRKSELSEDLDDLKPPSKKLQTSAATPSGLLVTKATPAAILKFVSMINGNLPEPAARNQSLTPRIHSLTDADLAFPQPTPFGHCKVLITRTKRAGSVVEEVKLTEGGTNNDSPRWLYFQMFCLFHALNSMAGQIYSKGFQAKCIYTTFSQPIGLPLDLQRLSRLHGSPKFPRTSVTTNPSQFSTSAGTSGV
jgi:hypothetical protein